MLILLFWFFSVSAQNTRIEKFEEAKTLAWKIHEEQPFTLYCHCRYSSRKPDLKSCGYKPVRAKGRAQKIEWEHVVPAEAFGRSFKEWREGSAACVKRGKKFRGRKCARKNSEFSRMESDLYNLWPEIGELNGLRSNFSVAALTGSKYDFGACKAKIQDRKFEPMDPAKGIVARTYLYMEKAYPGRGVVSDKNRKLLDAWDRQFPVSEWECNRAQKIKAVQGNGNLILEERCSRVADGHRFKRHVLYRLKAK